MNHSREHLRIKALLYEQIDDYDEMVKTVKEMMKFDVQMNDEEKNLFSVAFKSQVGIHRSSFRLLNSILSNTEGLNEITRDIIKEMIDEEKEHVSDICGQVMGLIGSLVDNETHSAENRVYYYKTIADYLRYKTEVTSDPGERKNAVDQATEFYSQAYKMSLEFLDKGNPARLGSILNFAVFYCEIMNMPEKAIEMAEKAVKDARGQLNDDCEDSILILKLLNDNISFWKDALEEAKI